LVKGINYLLCDRRIQILGKGVALGQPRRDILDQVEGAQLTEGGEQLLHLLLVQIVGQAANEKLVGRIRNDGADHPEGDVDVAAAAALQAAVRRDGLIVVRTTQLQRLALEVDAVKCHALRCLVDGAALQESEILVAVDVTGEDRVAFGLSQAAQVHLLVEEVDHLLLVEAEGDVAHVDPPGLASDGTAYHRYSRL